MTVRLCRACGGWHDISEPWPAACASHHGAQGNAAPAVIRDCIEVRSHVDGQMYTSKRALTASYRAAGVVEIGNEAPPVPQKAKADRHAIRESLHRAFAEHS